MSSQERKYRRSRIPVPRSGRASQVISNAGSRSQSTQHSVHHSTPTHSNGNSSGRATPNRRATENLKNPNLIQNYQERLTPNRQSRVKPADIKCVNKKLTKFNLEKVKESVKKLTQPENFNQKEFERTVSDIEKFQKEEIGNNLEPCKKLIGSLIKMLLTRSSASNIGIVSKLIVNICQDYTDFNADFNVDFNGDFNADSNTDSDSHKFLLFDSCLSSIVKFLKKIEVSSRRSTFCPETWEDEENQQQWLNMILDATRQIFTDCPKRILIDKILPNIGHPYVAQIFMIAIEKQCLPTEDFDENFENHVGTIVDGIVDVLLADDVSIGLRQELCKCFAMLCLNRNEAFSTELMNMAKQRTDKNKVLRPLQSTLDNFEVQHYPERFNKGKRIYIE